MAEVLKEDCNKRKFYCSHCIRAEKLIAELTQRCDNSRLHLGLDRYLFAIRCLQLVLDNKIKLEADEPNSNKLIDAAHKAAEA